ncbi:E3 ubiquitin-protein ligase RNF183 [Lates calcarifer]|uniref:E3 ubiquitin-protein ligase RNF183 n=1 Tax=Lates calcarifer TaxID=8187 RepID=A0A4W6BY81_LATCA|nr:E3 ubiquitin-protein ligase RNF183 [Lates calcarifer]
MSDDRERHRPQGSRSQSQGATQAPNVKPKLNQKERNSKEDQWKREKPAKVRRSRSTDSERVERGRRRERDRYGGERRQRGRSEEARRRDRKEGESDQRKVKPPEDDVEDTECAVCFCSYDNVFKTPKLLACGHTFCLECLARINVTSPELKTLTCPVCRELTELPHGQDLPRLGNNQDIIGKLPPEMQRALSIRFKRSKGKLVLKNPPPTSPTKPSILTLPKKSQDPQVTAGGDLHLSAMEQGVAPTTVVDVGRPPNRVRGRLRRLFRSDQCYYAVVASIITITVALMLVGILAFVIIPNVAIRPPPAHHGNQTLINSPESENEP